MSDKGWHRAFDDQFLPGGGELRTLRDAGNFIAGLPKHTSTTRSRGALRYRLSSVAERDGDTMMLRIHAGAVSR